MNRGMRENSRREGVKEGRGSSSSSSSSVWISSSSSRDFGTEEVAVGWEEDALGLRTSIEVVFDLVLVVGLLSSFAFLIGVGSGFAGVY